MNLGYPVAILGVVSLVVGFAMWAARWHHTIGKVGVAVGVVLVIAGWLLSRQYSSLVKKKQAQPSAP